MLWTAGTLVSAVHHGPLMAYEVTARQVQRCPDGGKPVVRQPHGACAHGEALPQGRDNKGLARAGTWGGGSRTHALTGEEPQQVNENTQKTVAWKQRRNPQRLGQDAGKSLCTGARGRGRCEPWHEGEDRGRGSPKSWETTSHRFLNHGEPPARHTCAHLSEGTRQAGEAAGARVPRPRATECHCVSDKHSEHELKKPVPFVTVAHRGRYVRVPAAASGPHHVLASPAWPAARGRLSTWGARRAPGQREFTPEMTRKFKALSQSQQAYVQRFPNRPSC